MKAYRGMRAVGKSPKDYVNSPNTFYSMRAAWTWGVLRDLVAAVRALGRVDGPVDAFSFDAGEKALDLIKELDRYKPDPLHKNHNDPDFVGDYAQLVDGTPPRPKSKWRQLKLLPEGWRDAIVAAALSVNSKYLLAIAALSLFGCRSVELVRRGVRVKLAANGELECEIRGAKYRKGLQGQETRWITAPVRGLDAQILRDAVVKAGGELVVDGVSTKGLWAAVDRAAKHAFGHNDFQISPMSMRHQVASDLKGDGVGRIELAMTLGHGTDKTGGAYGRPGLGKGGRDFQVEASDPVKKTAWKKTVGSNPDAIPGSSP